jgi:chromosome segregation ATPase
LQKVNAAKKLAPGRVQTAISLVGYEAEVSAAMAFVFGGAFICADQDAAKRVTFDKAVLTKSITLEGDVYDPSGTLSGGAAPRTGGVLVQVQAIRAVERELAETRKALAEVEGQLAKEQAAVDKVRAARRELEVKTHEVGLLEEQVNGSNAARVRRLYAFSPSCSSLNPDRPFPAACLGRRRAEGIRRRRKGGDHRSQGEAEAGQRRHQAAREGHGRLQAQQGLEAK